MGLLNRLLGNRAVANEIKAISPAHTEDAIANRLGRLRESSAPGGMPSWAKGSQELDDIVRNSGAHGEQLLGNIKEGLASKPQAYWDEVADEGRKATLNYEISSLRNSVKATASHKFWW